MRSRSSLLLILGVVLSVVTAGVLYRVATDARGQQAAENKAPVNTVPAIVALADIPARTVITTEMLTRKQLPTEAIPASAARDESEIVGQTSLALIPAGSFLLKPQLAAAGGKTGRSISIETGKVLVAFPTTDPLLVAGLVSVGDHVDLLATVVAGAGETARKTQTTLQNLEVVEVLGPTQAEPNRARALTFVVDHQVALFLKYLRDSSATVDVVVRSNAEKDAVKTQSVNVQVLQETFGFR